MSDNKVKLGDSLTDGVKKQVNQETLRVCSLLLERFFDFIKEKVQDIDLSLIHIYSRCVVKRIDQNIIEKLCCHIVDLINQDFRHGHSFFCQLC